MQGALRRTLWTPLADRAGRRRLRTWFGGAVDLALDTRAAVLDRWDGVQRPTPAGLEGAPTEWVSLQEELSEWGRSYFSDNLVSNEASMLEAATALERAPTGGAYLGVGPEQNFTYLAMQRPEMAFVIDVRRDNARLHWLYRALFIEAGSRSEWLAMLLGRQWGAGEGDDEGASVEAVLAGVADRECGEAHFRAAHDRVVRRLAASGLALRRFEHRAIERLHRTFFREQLDLTFQLRTPSKRRYPTLRSLLVSRAPDGRALGFLGTADAYARVRRVQREGRLVPVVGDLTGDHTLRALARELARRGQSLSMLYLSNVEQYVFEEGRWPRWIANLERLPLGRGAVIVRSYLDQGRRHPRQSALHRTTTVAQSAHGFLQRERRRSYGSYWDVVTDEV